MEWPVPSGVYGVIVLDGRQVNKTVTCGQIAEQAVDALDQVVEGVPNRELVVGDRDGNVVDGKVHKVFAFPNGIGYDFLVLNEG